MSKKQLSANQQSEFLAILKTRFEKNPNRHFDLKTSSWIKNTF